MLSEYYKKNFKDDYDSTQNSGYYYNRDALFDYLQKETQNVPVEDDELDEDDTHLE